MGCIIRPHQVGSNIEDLSKGSTPKRIRHFERSVSDFNDWKPEELEDQEEQDKGTEQRRTSPPRTWPRTS